jgi:oligosaccharyltransferase complex subunit alpha (ribophorin I)
VQLQLPLLAVPTYVYLLLQVLIKKEKQEVAALQQAPQGAPAGVSCYQATFKSPVKKGATVEFDVVATVTGVFKPNPAKIGQGERQYVEYYDNLYLLSPYEVTEQSSTVSCRAAAAAAAAVGFSVP